MPRTHGGTLRQRFDPEIGSKIAPHPRMQAGKRVLFGLRFQGHRLTIAHLEVSDEITLESRQTASQAMAGISALLNRGRSNGPMRDAPKGFVVGLMSALADTTVDFMIRDPANAEKHGITAFEGMWRMLG
jgi:hypothetical protein